MPIEPIGRPPLGWWKKMRPQIGRNPKYAKRSKEDKDAITAGIWQNYDDATKRKLRGRYAGKDKAVMSEKAFEYMLGFGAARGYVKDFGGWTSQNLDWERGFREGERKAEDNMRGIRTQRSREPQLERKQASLEAEFMKEKKEHPDQTAAQLWKAVAQHQYQKIPQKTILRKQGQQGPYYTDVNDPTKVEQGRERQAGLRYRAGERKEQHQKPGSVVANVIGKDDLGPLADPEKHGEPFYAGAGEDEEPSYVDVGDIVEGKGQLHPRVEDVQDHPGVSCEQAHPGEHHESWKVRNKDADAEWKLFYGHNGPRLLPMKVKRYGMFMPFETHIATKSYGFGDNAVEKGDLVVECFVSAPIKDLQGDVLDLPALMQAKEAMVRSPTNHIWLDHESPYAKPIENQRTPPIGKFVESKIMKVAGIPALWARWIVNKAHPEFKRVAYELRKGMYNAMSMEFMPHPDGQQQKMIGNKLVNVISSIKYFATSLVRAPANEAATVMRVYEKAFANSSRFLPIRVKSLVGFGQTVIQKGENENLQRKRVKEAEPENEPEPELEPELEMEPELEAEPEAWTGQEAMPQARPRLTAGQRPTSKEAEPEPEAEPEAEPEGAPSDGDGGPLAMRGSANDDGDDGDDGDLQEKDGNPEYPYSRKDYDRETGYVAPERATTAIGEWGDPALEKARLAKRIKRLEGYAQLTGKSINRLGVYAQRQTQFLKAIANHMQMDTKGIDEGLAPDTLGVYDGFTTITDEQEPPEVKPGKLKPRTQRFISTFATKDEDTEDVDSQEVGGEPIGKSLQRRIDAMIAKSVDRQIQKKFVVRKGYAEHAGPVPESVRRLQAINNDNGSLESQLEVNDLAGGA